MKYSIGKIIRNDRIDVPRTAVGGPVSTKKATNNVNAAINEMNRNITSRLVTGNTLTFSGQIRFLGPHGGANFGLPGWKQIFEDALTEAISTFMRKTAGQMSPEGIIVEPIGFSTTYKVNLPKVVPSVMTVTK